MHPSPPDQPYSSFSRCWRNPRSCPRALRIGAILIAQVIGVAILYQFLVDIDCRNTGTYEFCRGLRSVIGRALALFAGVFVLFFSRGDAFRQFAARAETPDHGSRIAFAVFGAATLLLLLPALVISDITARGSFSWAAACWLAGGALIVIAVPRWIAPWAAWQDLFHALGWKSGLGMGLLLFTPELARLIQPLWDISILTTLTFALVYRVLWLLGTDAFVRPDDFVVGVEDFAVHVAAQCSGVEGFMLVGSFLLLYAVLFHRTIRVWRFALVVLPIALFVSWIMNIVRIAMLILLGAHVSPTLAVDGFHSYAGWLFFTLLAMMLLFVVHSVRWLHRPEAATGDTARPLAEDAEAARLLPFAVFMFSGIIAFSFFTVPALGYPLRVAMMAAILLPFARQYRAIGWRPDPIALGAGVLIGVLWILLQRNATPPSDISDMLAAMTPHGALIWIVLRLVGTILLVPLIEELFFRGYVLARLDRGGMMFRIIAIVASTAAFALLHGRWLEASVAGLIFAFVYVRRYRLGHAVQAHMAANAVVATVALSSGDWSLI